MDRGTFVLTSFAGLSLTGSRVVAQRGSKASTVVTSEMTGAEIVFTASGFTLFENDYFPNAGESTKYAQGHIHVKTDKGDLVFDLFTAGLQNFPDYIFKIHGYVPNYSSCRGFCSRRTGRRGIFSLQFG